MAEPLLLTDSRVLGFYRRNGHLDVNAINVLVVNLLEPITQSLSDNLDSSHSAMMLKALSENIASMQTSIQVSVKETVAAELSDCNRDLKKDIDTSLKALSSSTALGITALSTSVSDVSRELSAVAEQTTTSVTKGMDEKINAFAINQTHVMTTIQNEQQNITKEVDKMNTFVDKFSGSKAIGNISESVLRGVLEQSFPSAQIEATPPGVGERGDVILSRPNRLSQLIEDKNHKTTLSQGHIDKFVHDIEAQGCSGIFISEKSGIVGKDDMEINVHGEKVLVYIHNCDYDIIKIKMALAAIDHLEPLLKGSLEDVHISQDTIKEICNEMKAASQRKIDILKTMNSQHDTLKAMIDEIQFPCLEQFMGTRFSGMSTKRKHAKHKKACTDTKPPGAKRHRHSTEDTSIPEQAQLTPLSQSLPEAHVLPVVQSFSVPSLPWTEDILRKMKVAGLRQVLSDRGHECKGLSKPELVQRILSQESN